MATARPDYFNRLGTDTTALIVSYLNADERKEFKTLSLTLYRGEKAAAPPLDEIKISNRKFLAKLKTLAFHHDIQNVTVYEKGKGRIRKSVKFLSSKEIQSNSKAIEALHKKIKGFDRDRFEIQHILSMISEPLNAYLIRYQVHQLDIDFSSITFPEPVILCIELFNINERMFIEKLWLTIYKLIKSISVILKNVNNWISQSDVLPDIIVLGLTQFFLLFRRVGLLEIIHPFYGIEVLKELFRKLLERNIFDFVENFSEFGAVDLEHYQILMRKNASSEFKLMYSKMGTLNTWNVELLLEGLKHGSQETLTVFIQLLEERQIPLRFNLIRIIVDERNMLRTLIKLAGNFESHLTISLDSLGDVNLSKNNLLKALVDVLRTKIECRYERLFTTVLEHIQLLLKQGADARQRDNTGHTPLDYLQELAHHRNLSAGFCWFTKRTLLGEEYDKAVKMLSVAMENGPISRPHQANYAAGGAGLDTQPALDERPAKRQRI